MLQTRLWHVLTLLASLFLLMGSQLIYLESREDWGTSTLLFLLIVEGLSIIILKEKQEGRLNGILITMALAITRLPFVNDVLLFGKWTMEEWQVIKSMLDVFSYVTGIAKTQEACLWWVHTHLNIWEVIMIATWWRWWIELHTSSTCICGNISRH